VQPDARKSSRELHADLWRALTPGQRRQFIALQVLTFLMSLSTLAGVAAIVPFFSVLADPDAIGRHTLLEWLYQASRAEDSATFLLLLGGGFIVMVVIANLVNLAGTLAVARFSLRVGREFHVALYEEYLHRDYLFHLRSGSVTLMNNVLHEVARAVTSVVQGGTTLVGSVLTSLLIVGSVLWMNPLLASVAAAAFLGAYASIYLLARRRLAWHGRREAELWEQMIRTLSESFVGIRDIQLRASQAYFRDAFDAHCAELERLNARIQFMALSPRYALECVMAVTLVGAALWLRRGSESAYWLAQLSFLAFAAYRLLPAMQQGYASLLKIRADASAFQRISGDLARARAMPRRRCPDERQLAEWRERPRQVLRVRDASFRYAPGDALAVRGVSLDIPRGALVGFVGANGSGKTTLADLILGLLSPESGHIEIDGIRLGADNLATWRATVAHVPQHVFLSDASLRENIAPGEALADVDPVRLRAAIDGARLDSLIADLPLGLDQPLGERAVRLSGGQRQLVGIARALYCRATLLVLDEATISLDAEAQRAIIATLAGLRGRITTIVIAHRLESVRGCDTIFEFDGGALVGSGTFSKLGRDSSRFRGAIGVDA